MTASRATLADFARLIEALQSACLKCQPEIPGVIPAQAASVTTSPTLDAMNAAEAIPHAAHRVAFEPSVCNDSAPVATAAAESPRIEAIGLADQSSIPAPEDVISDEQVEVAYNRYEGGQFTFEHMARNFKRDAANVERLPQHASNEDSTVGKIAVHDQPHPPASPLCSGTVPMMRRAELAFSLSLLLVPMFIAPALAQDSLICEQNAPYWEHWRESAELRSRMTGDMWKVTEISVSPDGETLAVATIHDLILYDLATLEPRQVLDSDSESTGVYDLFWLPDGSQLLVSRVFPRLSSELSHPESGIQIWDIQSGSQLGTLSSGPNAVAYAANGNFLVLYTAFDGHLWLWDVAREMPFDLGDIQEIHRWGIDALVWSPDSMYFAGMGAVGGPLLIWEFGNIEPMIYRLPVEAGATNLAWSPSGDEIAIESQAIPEIYIYDLIQENVTSMLEGTRHLSNDLAWSPNGHWIARGTRAGVLLWDMTSGETQPAYDFEENMPAFVRIAWLPDSRHLISVDFEGSIYRWDIETGCVEVAILNDRPP